MKWLARFLVVCLAGLPVSLAAQPTPAAPTPAPACSRALAAQDEVIRLLEQQVASLRLTIADLKAAGESRTNEVAAIQSSADAYQKAYLLEAEAHAADRKSFAWRERWKVLQYGAFGFAAGVLADNYTGH